MTQQRPPPAPVTDKRVGRVERKLDAHGDRIASLERRTLTTEQVIAVTLLITLTLLLVGLFVMIFGGWHQG